MTIITWNCNGAFREKFESLDKFNADILVIQECENPAETKSKKYKDWATNYLWQGDNKNKGLAVFAKSHLPLNKLNWTDTYKDHKVKHFLPVSVDNKFIILAVWTHQNNSPNFGYMGQFWKYLQTNKTNFKDIIIIGDFNSNAIWDEWDRWWNHSDVVSELNDLGIQSAYHRLTNESQGKESEPTFYLQKNLSKPYHIDYCFATTNILEKIKDYKILPYNDWRQISDHRPIVMRFDIQA